MHTKNRFYEERDQDAVASTLWALPPCSSCPGDPLEEFHHGHSWSGVSFLVVAVKLITSSFLVIYGILKINSIPI
jgi:hypothetical protein